MIKIILIPLLMCITLLSAQDFKPWTTKINKLSTFEKYVLLDKGTERAFSGKYVHSKEEGTYRCKVCDATLYFLMYQFVDSCLTSNQNTAK